MGDKDGAVIDQMEGQGSSDSLDLLLTEHRSEIEALEKLVEDAIPESKSDGLWMKYDDVFFLRYILSFGNAKAAESAVRNTFEYRSETSPHREMMKIVHEDKWKEQPLVREMQKWQVAGMLENAQKNKGFTICIRGGMSSMPMMLDRISSEEHKTANWAYRESAYRICDRETRKQRRLVKQVMFFDMAGSKLSDMSDKRMSKMHTHVMKFSAMWYPQLQEKMCIVNAPKWMYMLVKVEFFCNIFSSSQLLINNFD